MKKFLVVIIIFLCALSVGVCLDKTLCNPDPDRGFNGEPEQQAQENKNMSRDVEPTSQPPVQIGDEYDAITQIISNSNNNHAQEKGQYKLELGHIIAAFALLIAYFQYRALKKTIFVQRDSSERQLRAYVHVDTLSIEMAYQDFPPEVVMMFKNSGQTPAYAVTCRAEFIMGPPHPQANYFPVDTTIPAISKAPIPPGGTAAQTSNTKHPLTTDEALAIKSGQAALYYYGIIDYKDAFEKPRRTRFRYFYAYTGDRLRLKDTMTACADGNEAD
jgi:hypothetical protein